MRWFPVRVAGESMSPTLRSGDFLAVRPLRGSEPRAGQIVVVRSGELETVKRVLAHDGLADGECWIEGDNRDASTDSRVHGAVKRAQIAGVVRARYKPIRRARLFR